MHDHPILVRHIQHLTDARYFAAVGVDYISLVLDDSRISFDRWHAIRDWVEGVKLIAEFDHSKEDLVARVIIDAKPDGVVVNGNHDLNLPTDLIVFQLLQHADDPITSSQDKIILPYGQAGFDVSPDRIFLEADWNKVNLGELLLTGYTGGICFSGGKEEITGVRDYSTIDELMDMLRE